MEGIPVQQAMLTDFKTLHPSDTLKKAVELILAGSQQDFPVLSNSEVVGILTRQDLLMGLTKRGDNASVSEIMQDDFLVVDSAEMLESAFQKLQQCQCHTVPVRQLNELVGLLTMDNVGEFVSISSALKTRKLASTAKI
jgi:predicted transcriptional regulator